MTRTSAAARFAALAIPALAALHAEGARAGAFGLDAFASAATGQSNAGAAAGTGGIGSMFWNPATVTMAPGYNVQVDATAFLLSSRITPGPGTSPLLGDRASGDLGVPALVPSGFASFQVNDRVWVGVSVAVPYGATTKPEGDWAGQVYSRTSRVRSYSLNPVIGIRLTDWLSVAAGPNFEFMQVRLNRATSFLPGAGTASVRGEDVGVGFTAGLLLTPAEGTVIGLGYRSSVGHRLSGRIDPGTGPLPLRVSLNTPEQVTAGLTQVLAPGLRLSLGYEWTNWSRLKEPAYVVPGLGAVGSLPLRYRDGHLFSVGAEYDVDRAWTLRGGLGYEVSPVTDAVRSTAIPDSDRVLLSVGASYRFDERLSVDVAYQHAFLADGKVRIGRGSPQLASANIPGLGPTDLTFAGSVRGSADIVSVAMRYRFD